MSATLRDRAEHAAKYNAHLVVPAREIKQILDERDDAEKRATHWWNAAGDFELASMNRGTALARVRTALSPYLAADHDARCDGDALDDCNRCAATEIAAALAEDGEQR